MGHPAHFARGKTHLFTSRRTCRRRYEGRGTLWIEWIPRQDELDSEVASLALRPPRKGLGRRRCTLRLLKSGFPGRRWSSDPEGVPIGPTAETLGEINGAATMGGELGASSHRFSLRYSLRINVLLPPSTAGISAMRCNRWSRIGGTSSYE
jgi:hypothetical protein